MSAAAPLRAVDSFRAERVDGRLNVVAHVAIRADDPNLRGHFPGLPIFPGIFVIECLCQAMALAVRADGEPPQEMRTLRSIRFLAPLLPGDRLTLRITATPVPGGGWDTAATGMRRDGGVAARMRAHFSPVGVADLDPSAAASHSDPSDGAPHGPGGAGANGLDPSSLDPSSLGLNNPGLNNPDPYGLGANGLSGGPGGGGPGAAGPPVDAAARPLGADGTREHDGIRAVLPQRFPLLLVDRVLELVPGVSITTVKAISAAEPSYARLPEGADAVSHRYPPSLLVESLGQSAALLWLHDHGPVAPGDDRALMFAGARDFRFEGLALPGDVVRHRVRLDSVIADTAFASGESWVGDRRIAAVSTLIATRRAVRPSGPAPSDPAPAGPAPSDLAGSGPGTWPDHAVHTKEGSS